MADFSHQQRSDIVVLGGGLAGLTAAYTLDAPVYESAPLSGGAAASDTVDGFTFDRGIHVLQTKNEEILKLLDKLGVQFELRERSAHIYAYRQFTAYPFQINSTNLPLMKRLECVVAYLRKDRNPEPTNYAEWIYKTIGRGFGDTFLIPYSEKFWGVHPKEMSFEWTGNRVPTSSLGQVLRGAIISRNTRVGTNATFRYPAGRGGYGTVAEAIRRHVGDNLSLGHRATKIDTAAQRIFFNETIAVDYAVLLNTIPIPEILRIATGVPAEVTKAASVLKTNSIMVVNLGVDRADLSDKHWVHFPEKEFSFFRLCFPHNFSKDLTPAGMSSISCEVSYPNGAPPERDQLIQQVIDDLVKAGILRREDRIVSKSTRDVPYGYCIFNESRKTALPVIYDWLRSVNIVPGGRYGLWTYFWSDEAMVSGQESAQEAKQRFAEISGSRQTSIAL